MKNAVTYKALKYLNTKTGEQYPAYEVQVPATQNHYEKVDSIVVDAFDENCGIRYQKMIPWQEFAKYEMVSWPKIGVVVGVMFKDGTFERAKGYNLNFTNNSDKFNVSKLNRATSKIITTRNSTPVYEIPALTDFGNSNKSDEDVRRCFACPWERDNKAFAAKRKEGV